MCKDKLYKTGKKKSYYIFKNFLAVSIFSLVIAASITIPVTLKIVDLVKADANEVEVNNTIEPQESLKY